VERPTEPRRQHHQRDHLHDVKLAVVVEGPEGREEGGGLEEGGEEGEEDAGGHQAGAGQAGGSGEASAASMTTAS
jgi:hypothetical protein